MYITKNKHGSYDLKDASEFENLAYTLYIEHEVEISLTEKHQVWYTQSGFVGSVGSEVFYIKAKTLMRRFKINKITNGIKNR